MGRKMLSLARYSKMNPSLNLYLCSKTSVSSREAPWLPGSLAPAHLDGTYPGDFGFDPLGLGKDPQAMKWYRQAELQHARWAMIATSGILAQSILRPDINFMEAGEKASENSSFPLSTL